jgi:hypothetical protein
MEYGGRHDLTTASTVTGIVGQAGRPAVSLVAGRGEDVPRPAECARLSAPSEGDDGGMARNVDGLGLFGEWLNSRYPDEQRIKFAAELEDLGFRTIWLGGGREPG